MQTSVNIFRHDIKKKLLINAALFVVLSCIFTLRSFPQWVERFYSDSFQQGVFAIQQLLFGWIPFSLGDLCYILIIAWLIRGFFSLARSLFRKHFTYAAFILLGGLVRLQLVVICFYGLWAISYFRPPASDRLDLHEVEYSSAELNEVTEMLIDSMISNRQKLTPQRIRTDFSTLSQQAVSSFSQLQEPFTKPNKGYHVKSSWLHPIISYLGTAGYYNPLTGEAQVNTAMPGFTQPFTALHELAHQSGVGPEDEANFIAFIAGIGSEKVLFRYSAYYQAGKEFLFEVWRTDSVAYNKLKEKLPPAIVQDLQEERNFWIRYQGAANKISSIFYDSYLKANMQPGGLKTYNEMIKLTMSYYRRQGVSVPSPDPSG